MPHARTRLEISDAVNLIHLRQQVYSILGA